MDAQSKRFVIHIDRADDDARMIGLVSVQPDEMFAVQRDEDAFFFCCKSEDGFIANGLPGFAAVQCGQDIVTQIAEGSNSGLRKVLIGIKAWHRSGGFVLNDVPFNVITMQARICPGICKVFGAQGWIAEQQIGFAGSQTA